MTDEAQVTLSAGETRRVTLTAQAPAVLCRRFDDINFEFDRAFMIPERAVPVLKGVSAYAAQFANRRVLLAGHTDTSGPSGYNERLSQRRGMSAYAYLTGDAAVWQRMYNEDNSPTQKWGNREGLYMLRYLKDSSGTPYFSGSPDDTGPDADDAIRRFQSDNGLSVDGVAGDNTHRAMFDQLLVPFSIEGISVPANRFLTTPSGDRWLGLGERYLVVQTGDDVPEEANRRVEFLLFLQPPNPVTPDTYDPTWPQVCVQSELITVEILIEDEYTQPLATPFTLQTPEGDTLNETTGADGRWRSVPDSMPAGLYRLTVSGMEVTIVR